MGLKRSHAAARTGFEARHAENKRRRTGVSKTLMEFCFRPKELFKFLGGGFGWMWLVPHQRF